MAEVRVRIDPGIEGPTAGTWGEQVGAWEDQVTTWNGPFRYVGGFLHVGQRAYAVTVRRGRSDETEPFQAGSAQIQFRNLDGFFDPAGPFPLRLRQPLQVRSGFNDYGPGQFDEAVGTFQDFGTLTFLGQQVFDGFVEDADFAYSPDGDAEVSVNGVDGLVILSNQTVLNLAVPFENGGERIERVLDSPDVNFPGPVDIDAGVTPMAPGLANANVTEYLRQVEVSEQGRLFVDRNGTLRFRNRRADFGVPFVFADDGTGVFYSTLERYSGARSLFNRILGRRPDGPTLAFNDVASQEQFNVRALDLGELLTASDTFVAGIIESLVRLFARPRTRVFETSVIVNRLDDTTRESLLALDLTSAASAVFTPPGSGQVQNDLLIQGIEHSIVVGGTWRSVFNFEDRDLTVFFTLDDADEGRLNFSRLGF
jgi:hypothetical protein